jgi:hypothetical protein
MSYGHAELVEVLRDAYAPSFDKLRMTAQVIE